MSSAVNVVAFEKKEGKGNKTAFVVIPRSRHLNNRKSHLVLRKKQRFSEQSV